MDEQAAACRKRAAECERMVLLVDPANRSTYLHLARQWHQMAEDAERQPFATIPLKGGSKELIRASKSSVLHNDSNAVDGHHDPGSGGGLVSGIIARADRLGRSFIAPGPPF